MGEMKNAYKILVENLKGRDHSEDLKADGRIMLEWTLGKYDEKVWTEFMWLWTGTNGNEPSGSKKAESFLTE
jgi:hypothetical protein